jgi:DNA-binding NtrC family response regulator
VPPLREHKEDIPLLVETFIAKASSEHDRPRVVLTPEAMDLLVRYPWPGNVRELENLIESMVVLNPGREIGPDDIPATIRAAATSRFANLLPVPVPRRERSRDDGSGDGRVTAPELEFIFRTMLELRMDMEDLRREFDDYRRAHPEMPGPLALQYPYPFMKGRAIEAAIPSERGSGTPYPGSVDGAQAEPQPAAVTASAPELDEDDDEDEETTVVFRPGMTMQEMERQAILAALREVRGNRRKAADMLGIGERTLYRKIRDYEIAL